jgi:hypothetical protein
VLCPAVQRRRSLLRSAAFVPVAAARGQPAVHVPLFVVAYKGWKAATTIEKKLNEVDGVLALQPETLS